MIVRTYGRRNRGIARTYSDGLDDVVEDPYKESVSQESPHELYGLALSSQDSSHWSFESEPYGHNSLPPRDSDNGVVRKSKKARNGKRELGGAKNSRSLISEATATATLMETQEFGEMMEHVDEVNFALDGLRKGQPARIRRASLLSLLSICGTAQQRRLLRTQGMAKTIIDAVIGLSFDDSPSNLAAATIFFVLTSDSHDDYLLESPSRIRFLLELLKPPMSNATHGKAPSIGIKLLGLRKDPDLSRDTNKTIDSSSTAIVRKVQEVLVSCKEIKSSSGDDNGVGRPELSPKWVALLTMEKACFSTISLEDTSGTVRKTGGNFKEKFREFGGLDAVFDVAMNCHSTLEGWLKHGSPLMRDAKDDANLQSLVLLLKCLKIMENAAFLSKDNQSHLLGMKGKGNCNGPRLSFIKLILSIIKTLSGLSLSKSSSTISIDEKSRNISDGISHASQVDCKADYKVESNGNLFLNHSRKSCSTERTSPEKCFNISQRSRWLSTTRSGCTASSSETATTSMADAGLLKMRVNPSTSGSCNEISRSSNIGTPVNSNGSQRSFGFGKSFNISDDAKFELLEDSQDPFAFDEDDFKPSKWDMLSGKQKVSRTKKCRVTYRGLEDGCLSQLMMTQQESSNRESNELHEISCPAEISCSDAINNENSNLLADCLLNAVKVLMNLTNDNPVGCQQIADCGGLETMSALIADHFPSFSSSSSPFCEMKEIAMLSNSSVEIDPQNDTHLTDQELDFLVAILGLLVNLVEKDDRNRSRLAAASVSLPSSEGLEEGTRRDVIPLLCSIFLANKGAGEAAEDLPWNDEAALLQGEKEAEKMIVESYAALLLAFLSTESKGTRDAIADCLPDHNLRILVPVLDQFLAFHMSLNMLSPETQKAVSEVIESCRVA
ncbi:hypothetical protein PVL29_012853 [Vitis rotundifolia]|uniref:Wings apart-like protein C-terminal domain-containing protein n=1 Tax=Vitis rotundifolia TaxID=103349 RepID=A0AA38ZJX7_VITRO|nr:hypothetical protein PVL29_012853 [Vitis rotundifolia]